MGNPTDKPNFKSLAEQLAGLPTKQVANTLSDMYEQGYHTGLIYGGWEEMEADPKWQAQAEVAPMCPCCAPDPVIDFMNYGGAQSDDGI